MDSFQVLLDAPDGPTSRIQIARLGPVKDKRYGEFEITADNVGSWKRNLSHLPGQRALIDFEHRSEKAPRNSEAAGWITGIELEGDRVMADAEWSDKGAEAIRNKRYLFLSPAYGTYSNEHGETFDDTLCSTALTNKPVLGSLPMLTLASEERVSEMRDGLLKEWVRSLELGDDNLRQLSAALSELPGGSDATGSDSRASMSTALLTLLGLDETADETKILEAVTELKTKADTPAVPTPVVPEVKTLEEQAREQGMMILDAARVTKLVSDAQAGRQAATELHEERRDRVWTRALEQMVRVPAQEEAFRKQYELDADTTVASIEDDVKAGRKLLNAKPIGENSDETNLSPAERIVKRTEAIQKELSCDYPTAYLKVLDEIEEGTF